MSEDNDVQAGIREWLTSNPNPRRIDSDITTYGRKVLLRCDANCFRSDGRRFVRSNTEAGRKSMSMHILREHPNAKGRVEMTVVQNGRVIVLSSDLYNYGRY